jgi:hypothetical protein
MTFLLGRRVAAFCPATLGNLPLAILFHQFADAAPGAFLDFGNLGGKDPYPLFEKRGLSSRAPCREYLSPRCLQRKQIIAQGMRAKTRGPAASEAEVSRPSSGRNTSSGFARSVRPASAMRR